MASAAVPATTINLTRRLTNEGRTLLKITRVVLRNDDKELETYALMDGGSQRTIIMAEAAQELQLTPLKEECINLKTVECGYCSIQGMSTSLTISPATAPHKEYWIRNAFVSTSGRREY